MMNCRTIRKRLSAYQDKELGVNEQDRIRSHLQGCPECSKQFADFQYIQEVLDELPDIQPAPGFYLEVLKKISGSNDRRLFPKRRQAFQFLPSPLAMAAYLVIGLLAGTYLGNFMGQGAFNLQQSAVISATRQPILASLRSFDAVAPGTLASGYVRMVEAVTEEKDAQ
jgi:anti-sigma factor RsiW